MTPPTLLSLHVHPVKALGGIPCAEMLVQPWGPAGDRRWVVSSPAGVALTQREHPRLALATAEPRPGGAVRISAPGRAALSLPAPLGDAEAAVVTVAGTKVEGLRGPAEAEAWFGEFLGTEAELVHLDAPAVRRPLGPEFARPDGTVSFADGAPLLLTSVSSLDALNSLVAQGDHAGEAPLPMDRFRPNVVVEGAAPWAEDGWRRLRIGEVVFDVAMACSRCVVTTTDQSTAVRGKEPLRTLARHRRLGDRLPFGQLLVPERPGRMRSGDSVEVLE
ncbi:MOSC domain-containing protein [Streptomyces sulphureus]|uniref:MOSC domain-containing protein n=1 Tax=Streptomyces sulphureus TaxID=47758 RepID=UPI00047638FE|nr:MOSC N-terminal beta barrel domain-containing protein [Streptomyces sulphureus]